MDVIWCNSNFYFYFLIFFIFIFINLWTKILFGFGLKDMALFFLVFLFLKNDLNKIWCSQLLLQLCPRTEVDLKEWMGQSEREREIWSEREGKIVKSIKPPPPSIFHPVGGGGIFFTILVSPTSYFALFNFSFPISLHIQTREAQPFPSYFFPFPVLPSKTYVSNQT